MPRTVVIVQARLGSSRLPGKVLMPLGAGTVLAQVLARCAAIPGADQVCCAVPDLGADDPVAAEAARCGASIFRGSEADVLARYAGAARQCGAEIVMRVTSDCPLIDPNLCGAVLALRRDSRLDYACNNMPASFPHGLDCEAFTAAALYRAEAEAREPYEREHVTPWIRNSADLERGAVAGPGGDATQQRWTLDFPEDYAFLRALQPLLPEGASGTDWRRTLEIVRAHPEIEAINRARRSPGR